MSVLLGLRQLWSNIRSSAPAFVLLLQKAKRQQWFMPAVTYCAIAKLPWVVWDCQIRSSVIVVRPTMFEGLRRFDSCCGRGNLRFEAFQGKQQKSTSHLESQRRQSPQTHRHYRRIKQTCSHNRNQARVERETHAKACLLVLLWLFFRS